MFGLTAIGIVMQQRWLSKIQKEKEELNDESILNEANLARKSYVLDNKK